MSTITQIKDTLDVKGAELKRSFHESVDRLSDKRDEVEAEINERRAAAETEAVKRRNETKEEVRTT